MKLNILLASALLSLMMSSAIADSTSYTVKKHKQLNETKQLNKKSKKYNETFNPRQKEYPNHLGFNDLHIQAIRHLVPDTNDINDPKLQTIIHHHCKAYKDTSFLCLMFHSGMKNEDKPIGFEYIITTKVFNTLPEKEKRYWHYHKEEIPRAHATFPDMTVEEAAKVLPDVNETYGKVIYFQQPHDSLPLGEPYVVMVQDMPEQD